MFFILFNSVGFLRNLWKGTETVNIKIFRCFFWKLTGNNDALPALFLKCSLYSNILRHVTFCRSSLISGSSECPKAKNIKTQKSVSNRKLKMLSLTRHEDVDIQKYNVLYGIGVNSYFLYESIQKSFIPWLIQLDQQF